MLRLPQARSPVISRLPQARGGGRGGAKAMGAQHGANAMGAALANGGHHAGGHANGAGGHADGARGGADFRAGNQVQSAGVRASARAVGRAATLFALGAHVAYGRLFELAFAFEPTAVVQPTNAALRRLPPSAADGADGPLYIGVHLRHRYDLPRARTSSHELARAPTTSRDLARPPTIVSIPLPAISPDLARTSPSVEDPKRPARRTCQSSDDLSSSPAISRDLPRSPAISGTRR